MNEMSNDQETSGEQGNIGRRRLVRGAVALAPLVLTLRSGGLAAASAGAAVVAYANVDKQGKIQITSMPNGSTAKKGDICVQNYSSMKNIGRISTGSPDANVITEAANRDLVCGNSAAPQSGSTQIQVAIISSASSASL